MPSGGGRGGFSILGLIIAVGLMLLFGINPSVILNPGGGGEGMPRIELPRFDQPGTQTAPSQRTGFPFPAPGQSGQAVTNDDLKSFVSVVLADTEDVWQTVFQRLGRPYQAPQLVIFSGQTRSGCGVGLAQMGPFYCPLDQKVYIDFTFYEDLRRRFGAPGDFAQAYVIAHEVGHHAQTILGIAEKVQRARARMSEREGNQLQVRMELQADCFAGMWAHQADKTKQILEPGDIEEALRAASAIGDDRIQRETQGRVMPDSFTHGTSEQRMRWFKRGYDTGDVNACDTFNTDAL